MNLTRFMEIERQCFYKRIGSVDLLFIHIPKTAGTSLVTALGMPPPNKGLGYKKHTMAHQIRAIVGEEKWANAFKLAFVRNPWERLYSHFLYRKEAGLIHGPLSELSFPEWVNHIVQLDRPGHLRPQVNWLMTNGSIEDITFIGRFERLSEDIEKLSDLLHISIQMPHLLKTGDPGDYLKAYNQQAREEADAFYRDDILTFGYSFEQ